METPDLHLATFHVRTTIRETVAGNFKEHTRPSDASEYDPGKLHPQTLSTHSHISFRWENVGDCLFIAWGVMTTNVQELEEAEKI